MTPDPSFKIVSARRRARPPMPASARCPAPGSPGARSRGPWCRRAGDTAALVTRPTSRSPANELRAGLRLRPVDRQADQLPRHAPVPAMQDADDHFLADVAPLVVEIARSSMPASSGMVSSVMSTPNSGYPASIRAASIASWLPTIAPAARERRASSSLRAPAAHRRRSRARPAGRCAPPPPARP